MTANTTPDPVQKQLTEALKSAESLKQRIETGQNIDLEEFRRLALQIADQMEAARSQLEKVVGPVDPDLLSARLKQQLSEEEYEEWLEFEKKRQMTPVSPSSALHEREQN